MSRKVSLALLVVFCLGIGAANAQNLETGTLQNVGNAWQTVTLSQSYASMVVVCVINYSATDAPAVVRVQNATGNSFQVRVQNPGDLVAIAVVAGVASHARLSSYSPLLGHAGSLGRGGWGRPHTAPPVKL